MNYTEIKKTLSLISDPLEKLEMVMDIGKQLSQIPDAAKCTDITGCASLVRICLDGKQFYGWADSSLVRGIVVIILSMVDGKSTDEIKQIGLQAEFSTLGLNLGAGRLSGVNSMISFLENL